MKSLRVGYGLLNHCLLSLLHQDLVGFWVYSPPSKCKPIAGPALCFRSNSLVICIWAVFFKIKFFRYFSMGTNSVWIFNVLTYIIAYRYIRILHTRWSSDFQSTSGRESSTPWFCMGYGFILNCRRSVRKALA